MSEKSKNLIYYKLGKMHYFVEGKNLVIIRNNEVVAVDRALALSSGSIQLAVRHAHIQEATRKEYEEFLASSSADPEATGSTTQDMDDSGEGDEGAETSDTKQGDTDTRLRRDVI